MKRSVAFAGMVPMLVAGGALFWLAVRPCEPVAQASEETGRVWVGEVVLEPAIPEVSVESLPRVHANPLAHTSRKVPTPCTQESPDYSCSWQGLLQGTVDTRVQVCACSGGNHR